MSILLNNKLLQAAEQKVEAGLTPANKDNYLKIVVAGLRVALDQGPDGLMASLKKSRDPVSDAAVGAVNLVFLMSKQSRGTMPPEAMVPAAMAIMLQALDFVDKARITKVTAKKLNRATKIFTDRIFAAFKITPEQLKAAGGKVQTLMQDPANRDIIARRAGVEKDPRASAPTGMPLANPGGMINRSAGGRNGV